MGAENGIKLVSQSLTLTILWSIIRALPEASLGYGFLWLFFALLTHSYYILT